MQGAGWQVHIHIVVVSEVCQAVLPQAKQREAKQCPKGSSEAVSAHVLGHLLGRWDQVPVPQRTVEC